MYQDTERCKKLPCHCGTRCVSDETVIMQDVCRPPRGLLQTASRQVSKTVPDPVDPVPEAAEPVATDAEKVAAANDEAAVNTEPKLGISLKDVDPKILQDAREKSASIINNMITPPNASGKLLDAINGIDIDNEDQKDMVRITEEKDGNLRKLKASMLLLHECAAMPDCPADGCCTPSGDTHALYTQARNDAYIAYHQAQEEGDASKQAYLDLMGQIGQGKKVERYEAGHALHGKHEKYRQSHSDRHKEMTPKSCRHNTLNVTKAAKRMVTGIFCVDTTEATADDEGNVMTKKQIEECETMNCQEYAMEDSKGAVESCKGGMFKVDPYTCTETGHNETKTEESQPAPPGPNLLMIAIAVISLVVVGGISFLGHKVMTMEQKAPGAGGNEWGEEYPGDGGGGDYNPYAGGQGW